MKQLLFAILPSTTPARPVPASVVPGDIRAALLPQIQAERGPVPARYADLDAAWRYELTPRAHSALLTLWRGPRQLAVLGVALNAAEAPVVWERLEQHWLALYDAGARQLGHGLPESLTTLPVAPTPAPWAALVLLPGEHLREARWLVRFTLDMAWAFSDVVSRSPRAYPPAA